MVRSPLVVRGAGPSCLELTVPRFSRKLRGIVRDETEAALGGAEILVSCPASPAFLTAETDAEGRFAIDCPDGAIHLAVHAWGYLPVEAEVSADNPELGFVLRRGRGLLVRFPLRSPPPIDAEDRIELAVHAAGRMVCVSSAALESDAAIVRLLEALPDDAPLTVVLLVPGFVPIPIEVPGGATEITAPEVALDEGLTLRGRVEDPTGFMAAGGFGSVEVAGSWFEHLSGTFRRGGTFEVRGVPPEPVSLRINVISPPRGDRKMAAAAIALDPRTLRDGHVGVVRLALEAY